MSVYVLFCFVYFMSLFIFVFCHSAHCVSVCCCCRILLCELHYVYISHYVEWRFCWHSIWFIHLHLYLNLVYFCLSIYFSIGNANVVAAAVLLCFCFLAYIFSCVKSNQIQKQQPAKWPINSQYAFAYTREKKRRLRKFGFRSSIFYRVIGI